MRNALLSLLFIGICFTLVFSDRVNSEIIPASNNLHVKSSDIFVGYSGNKKDILVKLLESYGMIYNKTIYVYDNSKGDPIVKNSTSGQPFSILFSDTYYGIEDMLIKNGFADWMIRFKIENNVFYFTIPYQNINRVGSLNLLKFLLEEANGDVCDVVFKGNEEKLDEALKKFIAVKVAEIY